MVRWVNIRRIFSTGQMKQDAEGWRGQMSTAGIPTQPCILSLSSLNYTVTFDYCQRGRDSDIMGAELFYMVLKNVWMKSGEGSERLEKEVVWRGPAQTFLCRSRLMR